MDGNLIRVDLSGVVNLLPDVPGAKVASKFFDLGHQIGVRYEREGHATSARATFKNWSPSAIRTAAIEAYTDAVKKWHENAALIASGVDESNRMNAALEREQISQAVRATYGDAA